MKSKHLITISLILSTMASLSAAANALKPAFVESLLHPYLQIQEGLAGDDLEAANSGSRTFLEALKQAGEEPVDDKVVSLKDSAMKIAAAAPDLKAARAHFLPLSETMTALVDQVGTEGNTPLYLAHCPMAFDGKGGDWLQGNTTVANPYYGAMMLRCGSIKEQVAGGKNEPHADGHKTKGHEHMGHGSGPSASGTSRGDVYSAENLDMVHAGVPGYNPVPAGKDSSSASGCQMSCCTD